MPYSPPRLALLLLVAHVLLAGGQSVSSSQSASQSQSITQTPTQGPTPSIYQAWWHVAFLGVGWTGQDWCQRVAFSEDGAALAAGAIGASASNGTGEHPVALLKQ